MNNFFSVIVVTYNAAQSIENTLSSISKQKRDLYELIVIDGASKDATLNLIELYGDVDIIISEPDKGIYDAMNKGIALSKGEYIVFMNAGDTFYDRNTLANVYDFLSKNSVDLYAGSAKVTYSNGTLKEKKPQPIKINCYYTPVCHQSLYAKTELMKKNNFDFINYSIAADFDFMIKIVNYGGTSFVTNSPLSIVTAEGISDMARIKVWREYESIFSKYNKMSLSHRFYYKRQISIQYIKKVFKTFKKIGL